MEWQELYWRLKALAEGKPDDEAYAALQAEVLPWAVKGFAGRGAIVDDVVADASSFVVERIRAAHGPDTFAGFVYGCFRTVRKRYFRAQERTQPLNGGHDLPSPDPDRPSISEEDYEALIDCLDDLEPREEKNHSGSLPRRSTTHLC